MGAPPPAGKLRPEHLERQAVVYIRQSTLWQVREHTGSTARQYDLVDRAVALGWRPEQIRVCDQDQGQSGAAAAARTGFQELVAAVGLGRVGAVFCLEASRLARACLDWYRLLEICALTRTLVVDADGIYDPTQYNDRLLLGFKGTMSEAELHWLRERLLGGKREKARQGTLRLRLPVGYVYTPDHRVGLDPDAEVRAAVTLLFQEFARLGTALGVVRHFRAQGLRFPSRPYGAEGEAGDGVVWSPLRQRRILEVLRNPVYAGAYTYGRSATRTVWVADASAETGGRHRQRTSGRQPAEWTVLRADHHPGYLTWEQYLENQERLAANWNGRRPAAAEATPAGQGRGAPREGAALLQGVARCGRCGRGMTVLYPQDGRTPYYQCAHDRVQYTGPTCQSLRGEGVDAAVTRLLLAAVQPAALTVALEALAAHEAHRHAVEQQWELRRERATYAVDLARRRFRQVDPENRLVARHLEQEWEAALAAREQVDREYAARPRGEPLPVAAAEREQILALAQDLPALWAAPTTTWVARKELLRCLITEVTLLREGEAIRLWVRWQTGAVTETAVPRPQRIWETKLPEPALLARLAELAPTHAPGALVALLNAEGWTTGTGLPFTVARLGRLRRQAGITPGCPEDPRLVPDGERGDGRLTVKATAARLNVHVSTVARWCAAGRLDAVQGGPGGPRWIRLPAATEAALRRPFREHYQRRGGGGAAPDPDPGPGPGAAPETLPAR